ncbi:MAG TPA: hypothetical protein VGB30_01870, partial [bacterium]
YRYNENGRMAAMGRVEGDEIVAGSGEPYSTERAANGRIQKVVYPNDAATGDPGYQYIYEYDEGGQLKQVALYSTYNADSDQWGPQVYVVQYFYDDAGRIVRKRVIDNTVQETINTRYETEWEYDGMGRITRERTLQYDSSADMMVTLRDEHKTYDLGGNVTEIKLYDVDGYAYTLTQTFAQGYQITDFSVSADSSVTSSTSGSFTYDTNNNILTTKEFSATRTSSGKQLDYRGLWTFTYDRANRLKSYTNSQSGGSRGNVWYDSKGSNDHFLSKYSFDGTYQWTLTWGGSGNDILRDLDVDSSENIFLGGYFSGTVDFDPGPGDASESSNGIDDCSISKFDSTGTFQWVRTFGENLSNQIWGLAVDESGNVFSTGYFYNSMELAPTSAPCNTPSDIHASTGFADIFVTKHLPDGCW